MSLSRMVVTQLPALGGLAVIAAVLLAAGPASAQQSPSGTPPPGASKMWPWNVGFASAPANAVRSATPVAPRPTNRAAAGLPPHWDGTFLVTVTRPAPTPAPGALTVDLRGPDGVLRSFPVEGGRASIQQTQEVVVRPGASATIRVTANPR
jgi:hypothetical protein